MVKAKSHLIKVAFLESLDNDTTKIIKLHIANNIAEDVTNNRAKQQQNSDNNDSDQNKNKSVFYQTLTFFAGKE
jgi:hypothetical protein